MVIWINGAFGAGKTRVARRIASLRPEALLFDPEQVGFLLRRLLPREDLSDFQDRPLWRSLTLLMLAEADATAKGPVVVPMTLANPAYFDELVGGLRRNGVDLRHFTLTATGATLRRRLSRRLDWPASRRWALARTEGCAAALAGPAFAVHIDTEGRKVAEIAADILARANA